MLKKCLDNLTKSIQKAFDYKKLPSVYLKQFNIKIDEYVSHHHLHAFFNWFDYF